MNLLNHNFHDTPGEPIRGQDLFFEKRVIVFGLPGAYTPTCSNKQLPRFEAMYDQFQEKGIDAIYCVSVNDPFVMRHWGKHQGVDRVKLLPDGTGEFTRKLGMLVDKSNIGFGMRSWRYAAVINNGNVEQLFAEAGIEDDHGEDPYEMSKPETVLKYL